VARAISDDDVVSIADYFSDLEDPRSSINRKHLLEDVMVICILAVIAGADGPRSIGLWAESHSTWLAKYLRLPNGVPSHDTIGRILCAIKPNLFRECFEQWITTLREEHESLSSDKEVIAIDGKTLRRSHDRAKSLDPLHLVSAWAVNAGVSLGQVAADAKSNEITAIPELLGQISVANSIVTIDAAGCQKRIAAKIVDRGGDYVLALKANQGYLFQQVQEFIVKHMENDFADVTSRKFEEDSKGHGRVTKRVYYQLNVPDELLTADQWPDLKTIGVAVRMTEEKGEHTSDVRYFISSLGLGVKRFANAIRKHWAIENTLHWSLDVTFREDDSRVRNRHAADNLAWLKRFAISLIKRQKSKESIAMRRRQAGWNPTYLAQILGLERT